MTERIEIEKATYRRGSGGAWMDVEGTGVDAFIPVSDHRWAVLDEGYVFLSSRGERLPELDSVTIVVDEEHSEEREISGVVYWPEMAAIVRGLSDGSVDLEDGDQPLDGPFVLEVPDARGDDDA